MFDVLIRGGWLVDGSGAPGRPADVGIVGELVEAVGHLAGAEAALTLDAAERVVAPGFVDTHVHSDVMILSDPQHAPKLCQGVTTEILGQDGTSYAPLSPLNLQLCRRYLAGYNGNPPILWDWSSVAEFRSRFDGTVAVNTAYLVPHGAVRLETVGWCDVPLRGQDMRRAQDLIRRGLDEGAVGFSTGLSYFPCSYADTEEIVNLCRPVAERGVPYVVHLRTVFRGEPVDPVEETLEIGRRTGVPLHFSHFRTDPHNAGRVDELMAPIDAAQAEGLDVTLELYPYPSGATKAAMYLPPWAHEGGPDHVLARLADRTKRNRIKAEMNTQRLVRKATWDDYVLSHLPSAKNRSLAGLSVSAAARTRGAASEEDLLLDLLMEEGLEVGLRGAPPPLDVWQQMSRDQMALLARPNYMVGSDSILVGDKPHPRAYGCFPRFLGRLRREVGGMSLEAMVNRMTAVPAARFRLGDRGLLQPGRAADIAVFDATTLIDTATYENPRSFPVGMEYVLVNGKVAVAKGAPTGVLAGRVLPH